MIPKLLVKSCTKAFSPDEEFVSANKKQQIVRLSTVCHRAGRCRYDDLTAPCAGSGRKRPLPRCTCWMLANSVRTLL